MGLVSIDYLVVIWPEAIWIECGTKGTDWDYQQICRVKLYEKNEI